MKGAFFSAALLAALVFPALSISCNLSGDTTGERVTDCPDDIAQRAFRFAELYETSGAEYEFGGQSPLRSVPMIDCSGLVVMCYKYALVDTQYFLLLAGLLRLPVRPGKFQKGIGWAGWGKFAGGKKGEKSNC